ncbi:MAG: pyridoxal-phosphate dependent enzyme [Proteobacteria bacterium]|nr:pyridoxal-phosphate dependent enzyme [Pseudomonadota bacterium]
MSEESERPILFDRYPELADKIDWIRLGSFPTPVQRLERLGFENLWIKRDDVSSPVYGGNKARKLEFVLGEVKKKNKKRVTTFGGIGTNHGVATAVFCDKLGLGCRVLLFRQPVTGHVKRNLLLMQRYGADLVYKRTLWNTAVSFYTMQRLLHPTDYFLFAGGSNVPGAIGFVNAAFELKSQIEMGLMPEPATIFCAVGSNGTLAGLTLGASLAGLNTSVVGVQVSVPYLGPFQACTVGAVRKLMEKTYKYLGKRCGRIPKVVLKKPEIPDDYLGGGYGHPTLEGGKAYHILKSKEGINLDPCYTSKAFAAVLDHCRLHADDARPVLYWHTFSSVDLSGEIARADYHDLPRELQGFMEEDEIGYETPITFPTENRPRREKYPGKR